jgi:hypothetical protein
MSFFLSAVILLLLVSLAVFVRAIAHAPEGYEDSTGFHFVDEAESRAPMPVKKVRARAFAKAHHLPKHAA